MTILREEIRRLAEEVASKTIWLYDKNLHDEVARACESAILAGVKLVLERNPSLAMVKAPTESNFLGRDSVSIYHAMIRELLKELE